MIKANELRINNILNYTTAENDILPTTLDWQDIKWISEDPKGFNLVHEPIPLTEEWLLKFGFIKYEWNDSFFIKTKFGDLMIQFFKDEIHLFFTNVGADSQGMKMYGRKYLGNLNSTQNVKHVHQLQNLYFALTAQEIELK
ncbi:MAG: hypothetical protein ACK459_09590 [Akkermansiaceae bacterium]|jgi:hypothetical protein